MTHSTPATPAPASLSLADPPTGERFDDLRQQIQQRFQAFRDGPRTPQAAYALEQDLHTLLDAFGRDLLQDAFNQLEPAAKTEAPAHVRFHKATYRLNKRTPATIATSFGPLQVWSFLYLHPEDGEPGLHPLHQQLGFVAGATSVLAERVAGWAVEHSQRTVRQLLRREQHLAWSNDRLRAVVKAYRHRLTEFRQESQTEHVLHWLAEAARSRGRRRPLLVVGRDGVMVPIRGQGYHEASTATVSVYDRQGRRRGTVYLGQMPEPHQTTLTADLTALVEAVLARWTGPVPRLAYVSDKGQAQDDYWRRLRKLPHPRPPAAPLAWERVLDFYHVAGYVGKLSEALFGAASGAGSAWFTRMRRWLRDRPHGVAQILRSALQHYHRVTLTKAERAAFWKAYRYLRRHSRWMAYAQYRRQGLPLGSGVTEAACKTVFGQRLKRSGMRWSKEFGQVIVDLRVLQLSGIWDEVVQKELASRPAVEPVGEGSCHLATQENHKKAA